MGYTAPTTRATDDLVTAAMWNADIVDNIADLHRRTTPLSASVAATETRTLTAYGDLTTAGPAVTVVTGTMALVTVYADATNSGAGSLAFMGVAVSGASTIAADDSKALMVAGTARVRASATFLITGLTPGSNTFTAKYRVDAGTGTWRARSITVVPLGAA